MRKPCCVLLFLSLFSVPLVAQTVRGRVTTEGSPLPGVTVAIESLGLTTLTDADGRYTLNLPANRRGSVKITASFQGFQTKSAIVDTSGNVTQDFALRPSFGQEITVGSRAINAEQEKAVPIDIITREHRAVVRLDGPQARADRHDSFDRNQSDHRESGSLIQLPATVGRRRHGFRPSGNAAWTWARPGAGDDQR